MSKKLVISLSILFSLISVILILFWTLFALSSVSINFKSTIKNLSLTNEEILEAGDFRKGSCVFFESKKSSIEKIYAYATQNENFAYLKVVNIETVFPNKFVVHIAEREELFAVEQDGQVLLCDREFRVLKVLDSFVFSQENPILLKGITIKNQNVNVGDFLEIKENAMKKFYGFMLQNNRSFSEQIGKYQEINLSTYEDEITKKEYISMEMTSFQGRKFVINNIDFAFVNKLQKLFSVESSLYNQNVDDEGNFLDAQNNPIYIVKTIKNEYVLFDGVKDLEDEEGNKIYDDADKVALSYALLKNCCIKVDNLTLSDYVHRTEKDIYYSFVEIINN